MNYIYHGSKRIIPHPRFGEGNAGNDYGMAFYCTFDEELAREWACSLQTDGYSNKYEFNDEGLKVFDFESGEYHILNWLAVLVENRRIRLRSDMAYDSRQYIIERFLPDYHSFDVIKGYRTDDSFFGFANDFLNNNLTLSSLNELMKLGGLGRQCAIRSRKAFKRISFVDAVLSECGIYYSRFKKRDIDARMQAHFMRKPEPAGIYIMDIMRGEWGNNDERLRRFIC